MNLPTRINMVLERVALHSNQSVTSGPQKILPLYRQSFTGRTASARDAIGEERGTYGTKYTFLRI